jgi:hypothetical protein
MSPLPRLLLAAFLPLAAVLPIPAQGTITYSGTAQTSGLTSLPWVHNTFMAQDVTSINVTATGQAGFTSLSSLDLGLVQFTFTTMHLVPAESLSPGTSSEGFELYRPPAPASNSFLVTYNGQAFASGYTDFFRIVVPNSSANTASGSGRAFLSAGAGDGTAFYNEVMALTGNTGQLEFVATSFAASSYNPLTGSGTYTSNGVLAVVPEPSTYAAIAGGVALLGAWWHRRRAGRRAAT